MDKNINAMQQAYYDENKSKKERCIVERIKNIGGGV
jgi:hypothetical protein